MVFSFSETMLLYVRIVLARTQKTSRARILVHLIRLKKRVDKLKGIGWIKITGTGDSLKRVLIGFPFDFIMNDCYRFHLGSINYCKHYLRVVFPSLRDH